MTIDTVTPATTETPLSAPPIREEGLTTGPADAPDGQVAATEETPATESPDSEAAAEVSWHGDASEEDYWESEPVKARLSEATETGRTKALDELREAADMRFSQQDQHLRGLARNVGTFFKGFEKAIESGYIEADAAGQLFEDHQEAITALASIVADLDGTPRSQYNYEGAIRLVKDFENATGEDFSKIRRRFENRARGLPDANLVKDLLAAVSASAVKEYDAKMRKEIEKQVATREKAEDRANGRASTPPPAVPKGGGGGGGGGAIKSLADAERRYVLPDGHPEKISHESFKAYRQSVGVKDR